MCAPLPFTSPFPFSPCVGFRGSALSGSVLYVQGPCRGFQDVLRVYNEMTPKVRLGGPTNFAPLINKAIDLVKKSKSVSYTRSHPSLSRYMTEHDALYRLWLVIMASLVSWVDDFVSSDLK